MAASIGIGVKVFCFYRSAYYKCLLKSKIVTASKAGPINLLSRYLSSMQISLDLDHCFESFPVCQTRRNILSLPNAHTPLTTAIGTRLHNQEAVHERACWKCGRLTDPVLEAFFCKCGIVQQTADIDYFQLLGLEQSFDVDVAYLSHMLILLQKKLHPDKYNNASEFEKELAEKQSSLINKAYTTLSKPLPRAIYLLDLHNLSIKEQETEGNEFLNDIMEINEKLMDASGKDEVASLERDVSRKLDITLKKMSEAFTKNDFAGARPYVVHYQYYSNLCDKIKLYYRELMA